MTVPWSDLTRDGIRLERVIKQCDTKMESYEDNPDLQLAYMDRLLKATHQKTIVIESVLSVRKALAELKKITHSELPLNNSKV